MKIKKYKNGNFSVQREPDYDTPLDDPDFGCGLNLVFDLVNSAELDFNLAGDEGCAGNFDMYYPLYNYHTGLLYLSTGANCKKYAEGEWVHLYGRQLDKDDVETMLDEDLITEDQLRKFEVYQLEMWMDGDGMWVQNNQYNLGEIILIEHENLKADLLRAMFGQLRVEIDPRKVLLDDSYDGFCEIVARKHREPLFRLREV